MIIREEFVKLLLDSFGKLSVRKRKVGSLECASKIIFKKSAIENSYVMSPMRGEREYDVAKTVLGTIVETVKFCTMALFGNQCTSGFHGVNEPVKEEKMEQKRFRSNLYARSQGFWMPVKEKEKVIACMSRQLKVLMKDYMANVVDGRICTKYFIHPGSGYGVGVVYRSNLISGFRTRVFRLLLQPEYPSRSGKRNN
ncbi:hypothetical protein Tco_0527072 [Tanacetum coccineum]